LEHTFDRSGQVLEEIYKLDLPVVQNLQIRINQRLLPIPQIKPEKVNWLVASTFGIYPPETACRTTWLVNTQLQTSPHHVKWETLESKLQFQLSYSIFPPEFEARVRQLTASFPAQMEKIEWFYELVSNHIRTADLPFGATGYSLRDPLEILSSGYATPKRSAP